MTQSREALTMGEYPSSKDSSLYAKVLSFVAVVMTIATVVLAILYGLGVGSTPCDNSIVVTDSPSKPTTAPQQEMCTTMECVTAASRILNTMNLTVDPCDDFFEYACGIWNRDHIIADDQSGVSTFNQLRDDVSKVLKRVLESSSTGDRDSIGKAKDFYASCMDTKTIDEAGVTPVKELIQAMGGWPVIGDSFDMGTFDFETRMAQFRSTYGSYGIMAAWVSSDDKISTANILQMDQPNLGMPNRDYYLKESTRNATMPGYKQFMTDFITAVAGDAANDTAIVSTVNEILEFETALATEMKPDSERRDSTAIYNKMQLSDLDASSDIDWPKYINALLEVTDGPLTVTNDENVVIYAPEYLANISGIINERWELVQNYMVWRVLKDRVSFMSTDLRATRNPYSKAVSGTTAEAARWMTCSDTANSYFSMPVGSLFVQEAFPEENKAVTLEMVENIRTAFKGFLPANDWMDEPTKQQAESKADDINPIIAYPDYIVDEADPKMDNEYKDVKINIDQYFANIQDLVALGAKESFGKLRTPVDFEEWITGPAIVNAFYSPTRNQIVFPAGILQPPFYDAGQPNSMNYGGIGMVIGHEITHGFDDNGAQYDGQGNLDNWWSPESKKNFNERATCMVNQYSDIAWDTAGGKHLDGNLTLGENIADNGGIREAYEAYKTWQQTNPTDLVLPGLTEFTQDQLFFLGYAQVWCGTYKPEYAVRLLTTDPHSPGKFRVEVPSFNFPSFGEAYNCKKGTDRMYPNEEDTCRVW